MSAFQTRVSTVTLWRFITKATEFAAELEQVSLNISFIFLCLFYYESLILLSLYIIWDPCLSL